MSFKTSIAILLFISLFWSCEKEEDYSSNQSIRIYNYTSFNIDTLKLISLEGPFNQIEFLALKSDSISDVQSIIDLDLDVRFDLRIEDTLFSRYWRMPAYIIDPTRPSRYTRFPNGSYIFGLFETDSTINSIFIALEGYGY